MELLLIAALLGQASAGAEEEWWSAQAIAPGAHLRRNAWQGMFGLAPFEGARVVPQGVLAARVWAQGAGADFSKSDDDEGGPSVWEVGLLEQAVQLDYGALPHFQIGVRVATGSVEDEDAQDVALFEDGAEVTDDLEGGFGVSGVTLRAKYAIEFENTLELAGLIEWRLPADGRDNPLASNTRDMSFVVCGTHHIGWNVWANAAFGYTETAGETGLFVVDDEPRGIYTYALGAAWRAGPDFSVFAQFEGSTSGLEFAIVDRSVYTVGGGARWRGGSAWCIDVTAGSGLDDWSADWFVAIGLNVAIVLDAAPHKAGR